MALPTTLDPLQTISSTEWIPVPPENITGTPSEVLQAMGGAEVKVKEAFVRFKFHYHKDIQPNPTAMEVAIQILTSSGGLIPCPALSLEQITINNEKIKTVDRNLTERIVTSTNRVITLSFPAGAQNPLINISGLD